MNSNHIAQVDPGPQGSASGARPSVPQRLCLYIALLAVAAMVFGEGEAHAEFGVVPGSFTVVAANSALPTDQFVANPADPDTQAGSHPFITTVGFVMNTTTNAFGLANPDGDLKDTTVDLPSGLIANPTAYPVCSEEGLERANGCPADAQIGTAEVTAFQLASENTFQTPLYNLQPEPGFPGEVGFIFNGTVTHIPTGVGSVRPTGAGGYHLVSKVRGVSQKAGIFAVKLSLWGVPAETAHDPQRSLICNPPIGGCPNPGGVVSGASRLPFVSLPTQCEAPLASTLTYDSWQEPGRELSASSELPPLTGCDRLASNPPPSLQAKPTNSQAGQPTGLDVTLDVPQNENPSGLATADLRHATVTLPAGLAISPPSAAGLGGCSDAQIAVGSDAEPTCPEDAQIGSLELETPLLSKPLEGSIYLGTQESSDPASGKMYRLFLLAQNRALGVDIKLPGSLVADPQTGRLTATFDDNPQLPFSELRLAFDDGSRASLVNPPACGTYSTHAELTSWAGGAPVVSDSSFTVDQGCGSPQFTPSLEAGVANPIAGKSSSFTLDLTRPDGQQNISSLSVTLPKGQLAKLAGVPLCPDAAAASGSCDASTQIGTSTVALGAGAMPLDVPQPGKAATAVYLAGPYKGAPYSIVTKVPAQAGPFDLGTVTVRSALQVDPETTQVTAVSDPLPQILGGVPLTYREVVVTIDRQGFIQNPTSCEPTQVSSAIASSDGAIAHPSSPYQLADCGALGFGPKLALSMKGGTTRAKDPALKAVLTAASGQANIGKVQVILPKSVFIDQGHVGNPCTRVQFNSGAGNGSACPAKSILGKATAYSPLLEKPLTGNVYFRSNGGERKLPDLVASLDGQIHVNLVGFIDSVKQKGSQTSRVRNTFASVPDAPVSKFVLELQGGKKGLLQNSVNLCKSTNKATVKMDGQNGKVNDFETVVKPSCGSKKPKKK
jgi:hypothetical protein